MSKLNPITALYLKVLEFISILLIDVGGKIDDLFSPQGLSQQKLKNRQIEARKHQRFWKRVNSFWSQ